MKFNSKNILISGIIVAVVTTSCTKLNFLKKPQQTEKSSELNSAQTLSEGPQLVGEWSDVLSPPPEAKNINPIHALLLPSGRILYAAGTSNRNLEQDSGVEIDSPERLKLADNAAIFDPKDSSWKVVPSIPESVSAEFQRANEIGLDLFCSGHLLLHDGRALFAGGTKTYKGNFQGAKLLWAFDEEKLKFTELPPMSDGRWYPTLLQLPNGKIAILSGLTSGPNRKISDRIDFFNPADNKVTSADLTSAPGYPFGQGNVLDHYPRILPLNAGQWLITGDGTGAGPTNRRESWLMNIGKNESVSYEKTGDRLLTRRVYGTAMVDPNSPDGEVMLMGGMAGTNDPGSVSPKNTPETIAETVLERYSPKSRTWSKQDSFLGDLPNKKAARIGHYSVLLPTGQFLVVNGGNYEQYRGNYNPLLFTYDKATHQYNSKYMQRAQFPRFYHNVALLLPDGRVWINGSNRDRAIVHENGQVEQGNVPPGLGNDPLAKENDIKNIPAGEKIEKEFTKVEIFSPPYLFDENGKRIVPEDRPEILDAPAKIKHDTKNILLKVRGSGVGGHVNMIKFGSATHAWDMGQKLIALDLKHNPDQMVSVNFPGNAYYMPPGHYMMFYVNSKGVPSVARTVVVEPQIK